MSINEEVDYGDDLSDIYSDDRRDYDSSDSERISDTPSFHGASSEKGKKGDVSEKADDSSGDNLVFLKKIHVAAQLVSRSSDDTTYAGKKPVDTLIRVLGVNLGNPIYKCMSFRCPKGKDLGSSVFAWARSWSIKTHPDGHDYTMVERGNPRSWDYPRIWDMISQATANCQLDPAPLQLLAICLVAPRTISDQIANGALKDLKDHNSSDQTTGSCLLAWQDINHQSTANQMAEAFTRFIGGCRRMVKQAKDDMIALSSAERPHKHNPILLLREYVGLPGKMKDHPQPWSRIFAREKQIIEKISEHCDGTEINWSMRRLLYVELVAASKRWQLKRESLMACMERIRTADDPAGVMEILTDVAYESKFTSIDTFLNLKRRAENSTNDGDVRGTPRPRLHTDDKNPSSANEIIMTPRQTGDPSSHSGNKDDLIRRAPRSFNPPARIKAVATAHNVNQYDLMTRMNKRLCIICGESGHMYVNCVKFKVSSDYSDGCCAAMKSNHDILLVEPLTVSIIGRKPVTARCGLDTMASVTVISEAFVNQVLFEGRLDTNYITKHPLARKVNGLNSSVTLENVMTVNVNFRGFESRQECWIIPEECSGLPACLDINIGYPDLCKYGIKVQLPKQPLKGKTSFRALAEQAVNQLVVQAGEKRPLPGASKYYGLLRPLSSWERKDTPSQRWVYEIHWDMNDESVKPQSSHDYSVDMFANLSATQKDLADKELNKLIRSGFWWTEGCTDPPLKLSDATIIPDDIVSFPLSQGQHKSTKVRLCSDARQLNDRIWKASYRGMPVSDCLNTIRGNYQPGSSIYFIDLEKAFYKIRLGSNRVLRITSNGRHYYTNCVIFGVSFGPSSLSGKVVLLLNAVLSVLLGREVRLSSVEDASNYFSDVVIVVFYDDICIMGNPTKCRTIIGLLCYIAGLVGDAFPEEKREEILCNATPKRHLGVLWSKDADDTLILSCIPIDEDSKFAPETVSRRVVFSLAGHRFDPLKVHPIARVVADRMRRWAGRSEGGNCRAAWNRKWQLSPKQMGVLQCLLTLANEDMTGHCRHTSFPPFFTSVVAYTDACGSGFGYSIHLTNSEYSVEDHSTWVLLEETADEYSDKERSWHINRKECYPMLCVLRRILYWVGLLRRKIHTIRVYTDNSSALSWAMDKPLKPRLIEHVELERMINSMRATVDSLKSDYDCAVSFSHIQGVSNKRADYLSRALASIPQLDPLGNAAPKEKLRKTKEVVLVVASPCGELAVSDGVHEHYRGLSRTPLMEVQTHCDSTPPNDEYVCVIAGSLDNPAQPIEVDYDALEGVADMSESELVQHVSEALQDSKYTREKTIFGISLYDILISLGGVSRGECDHDISPAAEAFVEGGAHGKYLKWDVEAKVLMVCDPLESNPTWRIYLPSKRARQWVIYRYHDHTLLSLHRSLQRVLHAVRDPPQGPAFWWDGMTKDISHMIRACKVCQLNKHHDIINQAPLVFRRWQKRFQKIQLDFAGPFQLSGQNDVTPWETEYLCLMICECTHMSLAIPTKSTTARDVMGALLIWFGTYGVPESIQLDACPAHDSATLRQFTSSWGAEIILGIPRRPESQGLIERLIRDVKTAIRIGTKCGDATLPWWVCAFSAITVHNSSPIRDGLECTPAMLAHSRDQLITHEASEVDAVQTEADIDRLQQRNYEYLSALLQNYTCSRADVALQKEVRSITDNVPKHMFEPGDAIKITRMVNGKRQVIGPHVISHRHPTNALLFYVVGFDKPFSVCQLLPFYSSEDRDALDYATLPTRVATAVIGKTEMPNGIKLNSLKKNEHWIVYKELDDSAGPEPLLMIYAARFLSIDASSETLTIQGLDHNVRNNSWVLPPKNERPLAVKTIPLESVIGSAGFRPTCRGTVPQAIRLWFADQGCEV